MYVRNVYNDEEIEGRGFMMVVAIHSFIQNKVENVSHSFEGKGLLSKQILHFVENEIHNELQMQEDKIVLKRKIDGKEELSFTFVENKTTNLEYSSTIGSVQIPLYTKRIMQEDGKIEIDYILNENEAFSFKITYE